MARKFTTATGESIAINGALAAAFNTAFAFAFWTKGWPSGSDMYVYGEGSSSNTLPIFGIHQSTAGKFNVFWRNDGGTALLNVTSAKAQWDGLPHHFICSVDASNNVTLWTDGIFKETTTYTPSGTYTVNRATIGALTRSGIGNLSKCEVSDFAIFDRALTDGIARALGCRVSPLAFDPVHYYELTQALPTEHDFGSHGTRADGTYTKTLIVSDPLEVARRRNRKHLLHLSAVAAPTSLIKTILGVPYPTNVKTVLGLAQASVKTVEGLA